MIRLRPLAVVAALAAVAAAGCRKAPPRATAEAWPELAWYPWTGGPAHSGPAPVDTVRRRLETASGYVVFADDANSWSEWLRLLPLAAPGTPVLDAHGQVVVPGDDAQLAGVVAIDLPPDQKSVDVVVRLHAAWRWNAGDLRMLYLSRDGSEVPLQRWVPQSPPAAKPGYAVFRTFLDQVLARSDSEALRAESVPLAPAALAPGAFFLHAGPQGEALIVLDVATAPSGERAMLLARARDPAERLHVLRPSRASAWFPVRLEQSVVVPRSPPFQWNELRGMKPLRTRPAVACEGPLCPKAEQVAPKATSASP